MASPSLRTQPIDRRRLTMKDRAVYNPSQRLSAINRVKSYKAFNNFNNKVEPFRTERTPGTGGLINNQMLLRQYQEDMERRRAESFRPENRIKLK